MSDCATLSQPVLSHQEHFITFPGLAFLTLFWGTMRHVTLEKSSNRALDAQERVRFALRGNWISKSTPGQLVECAEEKVDEV